MPVIGFIGTGTIGGPMAARLLAHDHELVVCDRTPAAVQPLLAAGATVAPDPATLARRCSTVFVSLPGPAEIETVVGGPDGLIEQATTLTTIVDLSTNALQLARDLAARAARRGIAYLDAPVSGGKLAARNGKLAVMVGGDQAAFDAIRPMIACFAEHIFHLGPAGSGTLAKLVNNQIFLSASVLIQEGFVLGAKAGMDATTLLTVLQASSAGTLLARAPLVLSHDADRDLFALAIAAKDVGLALDSAAAVDTDLPLTTAAYAVYQQALEAGLGAKDFFATLAVLEARAGIRITDLDQTARKP